jgi:hypothetical protein
MKKKLILLFTTLLFANDNLDEFTDFDTEFTPTKKEEVKHLTVNGNVKFRYYHFIKHTHYKAITNRQEFIDVLAEINLKYNKNDDSLNSNLFFMGGNFSDTYRKSGMLLNEFRDMEKRVPMLGIKEAYYLHNFADSDIVIGKMLYANSASMIYSPSDIYNQSLIPDPLDPYKLGSWLTKWDYYVDDARYSIVLFPFISPAKPTSPKTRWSGDETHKTTGNFNNVSASEIELDRNNKVRGVLGYRNSVNGYDITANLGAGSSLYSVLLKTNKPHKYKEYYPRDIWASIGISTTYKKLELHSEAYYQAVESNEDDDFISAVVGGKYTLSRWVDKIKLKQIDIIVEYTKEFIVNEMHNDLVYKSSRDSRAFKNDILLKIDGEINYKWSLNYFANFRLSTDQRKNSGRYQKIGTTYKPKDAMEIALFVELFNGEEDSYYGKWKNNDRIITQLKYSF